MGHRPSLRNREPKSRSLGTRSAHSSPSRIAAEESVEQVLDMFLRYPRPIVCDGEHVGDAVGGHVQPDLAALRGVPERVGHEIFHYTLEK